MIVTVRNAVRFNARDIADAIFFFNEKSIKNISREISVHGEHMFIMHI